MESVELAEQTLSNDKVPLDVWLYIVSNRNYDLNTPTGERLGGFICNRRYIEDQVKRFPTNYYTVVDGSKIADVMYYVSGNTFYNDGKNGKIQKEDKMKERIETIVKRHQDKLCQCYTQQ